MKYSFLISIILLALVTGPAYGIQPGTSAVPPAALKRVPQANERFRLKPDEGINHKIILERAPVSRPMTPDRRAKLQSLVLAHYDLNKNGRIDPDEAEAIKRDRIASGQKMREHLRTNRVIRDNGTTDQQQLRAFMDRARTAR